MRLLAPLLLPLLLSPLAASAASEEHGAILRRATEERLLPGYAAFAAETAALSRSARDYCAGKGEEDRLEAAYQQAFDAWMEVAPIDFGPIQSEGVRETVEYWPDPRGATASAVVFLMSAEDPIVENPEAFGRIAPQARGLMALDWLLYDPEVPALTPGDYPCRLVAAVADDLERITAETAREWRARFGVVFAEAGAHANPLYFEVETATRELYRAIALAVEETRELRIIRPLGSPERPAPRPRPA